MKGVVVSEEGGWFHLLAMRREVREWRREEKRTGRDTGVVAFAPW